MTAEGAIYFIILIGGIFGGGFGALVEILALSAKNPKIKYVPIAITGALFVITGIGYGYITGEAPALFGLITAGEILVLLVYFLVKAIRKQK